jgi:hypothetical protein
MDALLVRIAAAGQWVNPEEGAYTQVWKGTTEKSNLQDEAYYIPVGKK